MVILLSYILIFLAKTTENILATFRIIVLSNHKKLLGSILNLFMALIWIYSTVSVLRNFTKSPLSIILYALGCFVGSYLGCYIEEKLALGENMITCITKEDDKVSNKLRELGYTVITVDGYENNTNHKVLLVMIPRKKRYRLMHIIKLIDSNAKIISENATYFSK